MLTGNRLQSDDRHPLPLRTDQVGWQRRIRPGGLGVSIGKLFNLRAGQGETTNDSREPRHQCCLRALVAAVEPWRSRPVEHGPEIVLQDSSLERIGDQAIAGGEQELVEETKSLRV